MIRGYFGSLSMCLLEKQMQFLRNVGGSVGYISNLLDLRIPY